MIRPPPRSTRTYTPLPYATLFRSEDRLSFAVAGRELIAVGLANRRRSRGFAGDDWRGIGQHPGDDAGDDRQPLRAAIADRHRAPGRRLPRFQYAIGGQRRRQIDQPPALAALPRRVERNAGESGDGTEEPPS